MPTHHRTIPRAGLVALLAVPLVAAGCAGTDAPTASADSACPVAQVRLCADPAYAALVRAAVADAADRLAPALESAAARTALSERMAILSMQLDAGEIAHARQSLGAIQAALTAARAGARADGGAFPNDAADLDAIAITIQETAAALAAR